MEFRGYCCVVVIDVSLEDENYESNICVVNDSIVMCIKQRSNGVGHIEPQRLPRCRF